MSTFVTFVLIVVSFGTFLFRLYSAQVLDFLLRHAFGPLGYLL